jgi:uncharacterized membrane protein
MLYQVLKFVHVTGVVLLLGNVTITAFWKVMADRSGDTTMMAHAARNVIIADYIFTLAGIALILIGGYGMAYHASLDIVRRDWLGYSQVLFLVSGVLWIGVLIPLQIKLSRLAKSIAEDPDARRDFARMSRTWLVWGIIATIPLVAATYVMIVK